MQERMMRNGCKKYSVELLARESKTLEQAKAENPADETGEPSGTDHGAEDDDSHGEDQDTDTNSTDD